MVAHTNPNQAAAIALAGEFTSRASGAESQAKAEDAARILANAELPDAAAALALRLHTQLGALSTVHEMLEGELTDQALDAMVSARRTMDTALRENRACLLLVALGGRARLAAIAPIDYEALSEIVLARWR